MKPAIIIPTYWSSTGCLGVPGGISCYDHATPLDSPQPELDACLASLEQVQGLGSVILLVVTTPDIEAHVVARVKQIVDAHNLPDVVIVDSYKALAAVEKYQPEFSGGLGEPISLRGYGAVRNMGLLACCAPGCDVAVFLDDDEEVLSPDFLAEAVYGLGHKPRTGVPIMAKSGYFLDKRNSALADRRNIKYYDKYWSKRAEFNEWITQALAGPRISRSNTLCGGCSVLHAAAFTRVAFDPWITRGEDMDYLLNLRLYGMDVWFDNRWRVRHNPPEVPGTAPRFLQDVFRWTYERRKLEVCNSNIDLHKLTSEQLMPYPGTWVSTELPSRIKKTALLRSLLTSEKGAYWRIFTQGRKDAVSYAEYNCARYLEFQSHWGAIASDAWENEAIVRVLRGEGMLNETIAARMSTRLPGTPLSQVFAVASDPRPEMYQNAAPDVCQDEFQDGAPDTYQDAQ